MNAVLTFITKEKQVDLRIKRDSIQSVKTRIQDINRQRKELTRSNSKIKRDEIVLKGRFGTRKPTKKTHKKLAKLEVKKNSIKSTRSQLNYKMTQLKKQQNGLEKLCETANTIDLGPIYLQREEVLIDLDEYDEISEFFDLRNQGDSERTQEVHSHTLQDYGYCPDDFLDPTCPQCCDSETFMKLSKPLIITDVPSKMECESCKQSFFLCRKSTECAICLEDILWSEFNYNCTVCLKGSHSKCYKNKPPKSCAHCRSPK